MHWEGNCSVQMITFLSAVIRNAFPATTYKLIGRAHEKNARSNETVI